MSAETEALGVVLRTLSRQHQVDKQTIRDALPDITDNEFEQMWLGERTVYLEEFCTIDLVFAEAGAKNAYRRPHSEPSERSTTRRRPSRSANRHGGCGDPFTSRSPRTTYNFKLPERGSK